MDKMSNSELITAINDLRTAAASINNTADILEKMFCSKVTDEPSLTLEEVRAVLANKSKDGFTEQIRELLKKHGADRLSAIDPANYQALLEDAEALADAT